MRISVYARISLSASADLLSSIIAFYFLKARLLGFIIRRNGGLSRLEKLNGYHYRT